MAPPISFLVFHLSTTYQHASTLAAVRAIQDLGIHRSCEQTPNGMASRIRKIFTATATTDPALFTSEELDKHGVVVFVNNCGPDVLGAEQMAALRAWFERGGRGFVGVHAASAMNAGDPWYGPTLVGSVFERHPAPEWGVVMVAPREVGGAGTAARERLTRMWSGTHRDDQGSGHRWFDEWYRYRDPLVTEGDGAVEVLLVADEEGEGQDKVRSHPVAWCRESEGGSRSVYIQLGHFEEAWSDGRMLDMVREAILWSAGQDEVGTV